MTTDNSTKLNLLLVERESELADLLSQLPAVNDYHIYHAHSSVDALKLLAETPVDIFLSDLCGNGGTVVSMVREQYPEVACLIVFSASERAIITDLLMLSSIEFLQKPVDLNNLQHQLGGLATKIREHQHLLHSEQVLAVDKEFLSVALRSIGDGVITTDLAGKVTMINNMAETLTGWSSQEAEGLPVSEVFNIIDTVSRETIANPLSDVLASGETVYLDHHTTLLSKSGLEYQISDSAAPIKDQQQHILGMILVFNDITDQYQLRQEARAVQDQIQELFDGMQTMAAILNADGEVVFANRGALAILEVELASLQGKKLWKCPWFTYDDDVVRLIEEDYKRACSGTPILHDIQAYTPQGLLWVEFSLHAIIADDGRVLRLVAEGGDVSARKRIEDENYSALQHLKLYRDQTPLAAIEWDIDLHVVDWNGAAERMFSYTLDEVKGRNWADMMLPEEDLVLAKETWDKIMAQTGGELVEQTIITKGGGRILVEWHSAALLDEAGQVIGGISLAIDITQEHQAQQALVQQAKEQHDILNTIIDGVIMFSATGRMLNYNQGAERMFGYSVDEAQGEHVSLLRMDSDKRSVDLYLKRRLTKGLQIGNADTSEIIAQRKDKTTFPGLLTVVELPVLDDGSRRFIAVCKDLTEIKAQQAKLQRAMKMDALGKLVGGIAHDYNNMLGVILGYTELISMKFPMVEGLKKYIDNISEAGERGRSLTKRMLAFSKQESSGAKAVDVLNILTKQKEFFEKSVTVQIQIDYEFDGSQWLIWIDPSELEDALLNLTINAKHAMPNGGHLTFSSHGLHLSQSEAKAVGLASNDYVRLSVTDTGTGIEPEVVSKIFDPFFSTKGLGGTGLGLSQVYGCLERAGGVVRVYSQKGLGSEFVLYFPRYHGKDEVKSGRHKTGTLAQGHGETILVVDDEPALRELAAEILGLAGYRVLVASDGKHALEVMLTTPVEVLVSDVIMPNMDGYQLAKRVRELYPEVRIQLASGFSDKRHIKVKDQHWHQEILHKPYSSQELLSRINELLLGIK